MSTKWDLYMEEIYGSSEWVKLKEALSGTALYSLKIDKAPKEVDSFISPWASLCLRDTHTAVSDGELESYYLDPASALPVAALAPSGEEVILDLCAAPGGKSVLMGSLVEMAKAVRPLIICNELSRARLDRLSVVLRAFLGEGNFQTINSDPLKSMASIKRYSPYSAALVDAPCSSDRHRVADGSIQNWKISGSKRFQETQVALLVAAVNAVKRKGRIVYSTCSLSPVENDKAIEKVLSKCPGLTCEYCDERLSSIPRTAIHPEGDASTLFKLVKTCYGYQALPHLCSGSGPIYFCLLVKNN
eukprot:Protomagalhaensia_sp_Gyna_25__100@NODE_104_length_5238_cov_68_434891_g81_i0_p4_GENE_NODE_104_length_5238_cov_68_434891_g81_i0NODE_104_length_5238_cov_68_434891_g81_i0_p4_ORF_typecomplete_len302_score26_71Methyltr_RsmBF/PF01189_17/1e36Methyltrans_SAM/PF10672_9/0_19_NODE_104_length_5238_cov_68_434891_g81_i013992304